MITDRKREMRERMKRVLKGIPADERAERSRAICRNIVSLDEFISARVVMAYMPYAFEVDVRDVIKSAYAAKKRVCFPVVVGKGVMIAAEALETDVMKPGEYGILCPSGECEISPKDIDMVIVPGLAFDKMGGRLGKGGGFYDRFLPKCKSALVAPAFFEQAVEAVPTDINDARIGILATERFVVRCERLTKGLME